MKSIQNQFKTMALAFILMASTQIIYAQNVSDKDIKTNVAGISNALGQLKLLEPLTYEYNTEKYKPLLLEKGKRYGFIAEEFQNVFPEMVYNRHIPQITSKHQHRDLSVKKIDTESLIPVLVASIKELEAEVEKLKKELKELKSNNDTSMTKNK